MIGKLWNKICKNIKLNVSKTYVNFLEHFSVKFMKITGTISRLFRNFQRKFYVKYKDKRCKFYRQIQRVLIKICRDFK